ncbi:MAG TPA: zf-HC2 domain-containing protein [Thermoanaerobaculia bacterium]|nr:zf-HC2 domain-containing protein [Thermoanaerobaculia bacterium]
MSDERIVAGLRCSDVLAQLSAFIDGELDHAERERIEAHLRGCDWCERFGGDFAFSVAALRRQLRTEEELPDEVRSRLRARLR